MAAVIFVEQTPSSWVYPQMAPAANAMCVNELHHAQVKGCCCQPGGTSSSTWTGFGSIPGKGSFTDREHEGGAGAHLCLCFSPGNALKQN